MFEAIRKLYDEERNCHDNHDILTCIKSIVESIMNNHYHKKSSQKEKDSLYKFEASENETGYERVDVPSPEDLVAVKEYMALREQELDRLMAEDKEIEQYLDALLSAPNLEDDVDYLSQKLNLSRKEIYRIRRKLWRRTGHTKS